MKKDITIKLSDIFKTKDLRMDVNFWLLENETFDNYISFNDLFEILKPETPEYDKIPEEFNYCQIGNLDKDGKILPTTLYKSQISDEEDEDAKIYSKVFGKETPDGYEVKDIMSVKENDILIAKTRPLLNKILFVSKNDFIDYSKCYFTKAFIRIRCKVKEVEPVLCYYIIKNLLNKQLVSVSRIGKSGYPTIKDKDLTNIKIPVSLEKLKDKDFNKIIKNKFEENLKLEADMKKQQELNNSLIKNKILNLTQKEEDQE